MTDIRVWVDGALVAAASPAIRAVDHGVTVGDGGFETTKIENGRPYAVSRHLRRLDRTLAGLGLPAADHDLIRRGIEAVLAPGPPIDFGRLRWTVTGGAGPLGSDRHDSDLTHIVTASPQDRPPRSGAVVLSPWTRNERAATAGLKTTSYADNVVALADAKERGAMEALLANTRGELCEGTGSNVFVVVGDVIHTPPLSGGCLAGIARELTLEWGLAAGLDLRETVLPISVLDTCDEVFLTSSIKEVFPVHAVGERSFGVPGPMTARVMEVYAAGVGRDLDP